MKLHHYLAYLYHRFFRRFHKRPGKWQTAAFEDHHRAMKYHKTFLALLLIGIVWFTPYTAADMMSDEQQSIQTAQKLIKSTVKIEPDAYSSGSGFFVSPNEILTNYHVVKKLSHTIRYSNQSGQFCGAELLRQEEYIDLALYRTSCANDTFLPLQETAYVGQTVMVAGNPALYDFTVSKGVVSAFRPDRIQFDAKINFGSSGGVVANLSGEAIGVTVEKSLHEDGISFAIPAKEVKRFLDRAR